MVPASVSAFPSLTAALLALALGLTPAPAGARASAPPPPARAAGDSSGPFWGGLADTVYVEADRDPNPAAAIGAGPVTVVAFPADRGGGDLAESLAAGGGVQVRRYGGPGAESVPTIRGASGAQVALLVDGIPLADAENGTIDLASLPLERFAGAEIYSGSAPAPLGGGGAAAINLITRPLDEAGLSARLFAGSFGDRGGRLSAGWRSRDGARTALALVHGRRAAGDFRFLDHNQTFSTTADDTARRRLNADAAEWGAWLGTRWDAGPGRATASAGFFRRDAGRPGPLGYLSPRARLRQERADAHLSLESRSGLARLDLAGARSLELLHDDAGEVGWDPPGTTRGEGSDLSGRLTLTRAAALARLPGPWPQGQVRWLAGGDWRRQWYRESLNGAADPLRARTTVTAFAGLRFDLDGPRLTIAPSWSWQRLTDNFPPLPALPWLPERPLAALHAQQAVSPAASLVWEARPGRLFVEGHAARTSRAPTWVELFGQRGGIDGNRELRPERIVTYDLGLRWRRAGGGLWTRLTAFTTAADHSIVFVQSSQRTSKAVNFGLTRTAGLECETGGSLPGRGRWSARLTWQDARDRGLDPAYGGKRVPLLPPLRAGLTLAQPLGGWEIGSTLEHEAADYRDRYNSDRAPARTLLGASLARTLSAGRASVTVTAEVVNLTDNAVYDVEGFPLPGRTWRVSMLWR